MDACEITIGLRGATALDNEMTPVNGHNPLHGERVGE